MLTLDEDEAALAVMALRFVADAAWGQSANGSLQSGCDGAAKACVDDYCLPKLRVLIDRLQKELSQKRAEGTQNAGS